MPSAEDTTKKRVTVEEAPPTRFLDIATFAHKKQIRKMRVMERWRDGVLHLYFYLQTPTTARRRGKKKIQPAGEHLRVVCTPEVREDLWPAVRGIGNHLNEVVDKVPDIVAPLEGAGDFQTDQILIPFWDLKVACDKNGDALPIESIIVQESGHVTYKSKGEKGKRSDTLERHDEIRAKLRELDRCLRPGRRKTMLDAKGRYKTQAIVTEFENQFGNIGKGFGRTSIERAVRIIRKEPNCPFK